MSERFAIERLARTVIEIGSIERLIFNAQLVVVGSSPC